MWQRRAEVRRRGVALTLAALIGGLAAGGSAVALAAVFAALSGLVGALSGKYPFNLPGIASWAVRGLVLGTTAHGLGPRAPCRLMQMPVPCRHCARLAGLAGVLAYSAAVPLVRVTAVRRRLAMAAQHRCAVGRRGRRLRAHWRGGLLRHTAKAFKGRCPALRVEPFDAFRVVASRLRRAVHRATGRSVDPLPSGQSAWPSSSNRSIRKLWPCLRKPRLS